MTENTTSKSTNELLMRVIAVESPELFDGSEDELVRVTSYNYSEYCPAACETCGDEPEMLTIGYVTRNGREGSETYDYFGLPRVLEALDEWDKQHGKAKECRVDLDVDNPTIHPLSGPCMECCCYSTPELAMKAGMRIYGNMLKENR